jgi:SAM-dependent methyltransferase
LKLRLRDYLKSAEYKARAAAESRKWGDHLQVEARGEMNAWLDHPEIAAHYHRRAAIDGTRWEAWVPRHLGGPAARSLDLGCGAASRSFAVWEAGASAVLEGVDISEARVAEGERQRQKIGAPGRFWAEDVNAIALEPDRYDLVFSAHSFHHFLELEHVMEQTARALTPRGLFILEEFVGPTQFQWTDLQMGLTAGLLRFLPEELRRFRWDAVKHAEGRPTVEEVVAVSPFESIRSAEIVPLFERYFEIVLIRKLGGTLQHLLYNGIVHNFWPLTAEASRALHGILEVEDQLIDSALLPSDFMLLVGRRREGAP